MTKRNATARLRTLVSAIGEILATVDNARQQYTQYVGEQYVALGIAIDEGAEIHSALDLGDWRVWARDAMTKAAPSAGISVDTLYRIRNAGAVARVCEDADFSGVTYLALVPFYRVLTGKLSVAKTAEEQDQARAYVRALVAKGLESPGGLSVATAERLTEDFAPTRGKGAGNAKTTAANRKAAKSRKAAKTATPPITPEDSASREACANAVGRVLKPYGDEDLPQVRAIMLATTKLCESHSPSTVAAIVKGYKRS